MSECLAVLRARGLILGLVGSQNVTLPTDAVPRELQQLCPFYCSNLSSDSGVDLETPLKVLSLPCIQSLNGEIIELSSGHFESAQAAARSSMVTDPLLKYADPWGNQNYLHAPFFITSIFMVPAALTHFAHFFNQSPGDIHLSGELQPLRGTLNPVEIRIPHLTPPVGSYREGKSLAPLKSSLGVQLGSESQLL